LTNESGAEQELMRREFGIGGNFTQGREQITVGFHGQRAFLGRGAKKSGAETVYTRRL